MRGERFSQEGLKGIICLPGSEGGMVGHENTVCNIAQWLTDRQAQTYTSAS